MFDLAQKHIGLRQALRCGCVHQFGLDQALQRAQGGSGAKFRKLPATNDLQELHRELNFTDAAARKLDIVVALGVARAALGGVVTNLAVQDAQGVKHAVVQVATKDKRNDSGSELQGKGRTHNAVWRKYPAL